MENVDGKYFPEQTFLTFEKLLAKFAGLKN